MKLAIWSVTRGAGRLAKLYGDTLKAQIYTLKKFNIEDTIQMENFTETLEKEFNSYDGHIFIMATGIVVRKISTLIKSKDIDPAVVVIDEGAHFVISLLSGHLGGANELAEIIGDKLNLLPIITTSSDVTGKIAVDTLSQKLNGELESLEKAKNVTSLIVDGKGVDIKLPKNVDFDKKGDIEGVIIVSNRENIESVRIYPKNLVLGIGCKRGTSEEHILTGIEMAMKKHNLSMKSIKKIATVDIKADEAGLIDAVKTLGKELIIISREDIKKVEDQFEGSQFVKKQIGVTCVSEPCALLASSGNGKFLEKKYIYDGMTISIYEEKIYDKGKIYVVGIGPGNMEDISVRAYKTLKNVDIIAGYTTYVDLVKDEFKEKEFYVSGMKKEIDRCEKVLELAKEGKSVALISSGDAGIYGMAGIMIEVAADSGIDVEVIPGITASVAGAALVGAPIMHDQAVISLSDLLTDWDVITKRIDKASEGDFVISLYNPKSNGRTTQIVEAREIMLRHKAPTTPVALLRHVGREDQNYTLTDLEHFLEHEIDMFTVVIIGNSKSYVKNNRMITPRGYKL